MYGIFTYTWLICIYIVNCFGRAYQLKHGLSTIIDMSDVLNNSSSAEEKKQNTFPPMLSSWWFQPLWKILVKMGIFPK